MAAITQSEFNSMLQVAIAQGLPGGNYTMKYGGEEIDAYLGSLSTPEMHRMIFRRKNLGNAFTAAQKAAVRDGSFNDLYLGDYWVINGVTWRIADFDYWLNTGDTPFVRHHLCIMPDSGLGESTQMNPTNTTEGGYVGSAMYTTNMADAKAACVAAFGDNILSYRDMLVNAVANGKPVASAWCNARIELPSEVMIYGHLLFSPNYSDGTTISHVYSVSKTQFALFMVAPKFILLRTAAGANQNWWLRDVVSSTNFAYVDRYGRAGIAPASNAGGNVRPVFPVG